jgi:tripartite-type tricarboxylate transporter receptor subunit TctC
LGYIGRDFNSWIISTTGQFKDKSLKEIIEIAKKNPETIKVAIAPKAFGEWLALDVEQASGAKFIKVPFQGGGPGIIALLGGHIDIAGWYYAEYRGHLEAGKVQVIAQAGNERSTILPNVPTFNEQLGVNDIFWGSYRFPAVPKGIPRDRFKYLEAVIDAVLHDPDCIKDYKELGSMVGLKYLNGAQTAKELREIYDVYKKFFIKAGIEN